LDKVPGWTSKHDNFMLRKIYKIASNHKDFLDFDLSQHDTWKRGLFPVRSGEICGEEEEGEGRGRSDPVRSVREEEEGEGRGLFPVRSVGEEEEGEGRGKRKRKKIKFWSREWLICCFCCTAVSL